jgi:anti-anti-sigma regulatory factor
MRSLAPLLVPKVEQFGNVTVMTFTPDPVRDVENVIARELAGFTLGIGEQHLLLDFTNVGFLNSMELGTLITLHRQAGGRVTLFNLSALVFSVFTTTRLNTFLEICREEELLAGADVPPLQGIAGGGHSAT